MSYIAVRLSGLRDKLEPFSISKLASRTLFTELAGGGDVRDASLGAEGPTAGDAMARALVSGEGKRTTLSTLPVPSSVSVVMAGAAAGEIAAKRWSKETQGWSNRKRSSKEKRSSKDMRCRMDTVGS